MPRASCNPQSHQSLEISLADTCNNKFDIFKPLLRNFIIRINLKRLAVAVGRIVVPLIRKEVSAKIKPSLVDTPFLAIRSFRSELLRTINVPGAERS